MKQKLSQLMVLGDKTVCVFEYYMYSTTEVLRGTNKNRKWKILYTIAIAEMEKQNEKHLSSLFWMVHHFHVFSHFKNDCVPKQNKNKGKKKKRKSNRKYIEDITLKDPWTMSMIVQNCNVFLSGLCVQLWEPRFCVLWHCGLRQQGPSSLC